MGKVLDFYKGKRDTLELPDSKPKDDIDFDIEESEEETLFIDEEKLKKEIEKIKANNPAADIAIIKEQLKKDPVDLDKVLDIAKQVEKEQDMLEFEDEED